MFLCFMSQSQDPNLIQYDKQQTVSELHMDKMSYEPNESIQTKSMNSDIWIVCFYLTFLVRVLYKWNITTHVLKIV